jgi:hypothetical protein
MRSTALKRVGQRGDLPFQVRRARLLQSVGKAAAEAGC